MADPVKPADSRPRPRGRPRDPKGRSSILQAARALLEEAGPPGVTMEAVAARAGVGKPTVYRWFANRHEVAMAALMDGVATTPQTPTASSPPARSQRHDTPTLRTLERQLLTVADTLASRTGRNVTAMIAAADPDTEVAKAFRHHFVLARRTEGCALLKEAQQRGELRAGIDTEIAVDQIYGALFFRLLLGHAGLDAGFIRRLLRQVIGGLAPGA